MSAPKTRFDAGEPPSGAALAAVLAASLGVLALGIAQVMSEASEAFQAAIRALGQWLPAAAAIGPYAGKETLALLVWLGSWALLHGLLRRRELPVARLGALALILVALATLLVWPPVTALCLWRK